MRVILREPREHDWPAIHQVACAALPWAAEGNVAWLANRRRFQQSGHPGRHRVAEDGAGRIVGYSAVEGEAQPGRFRIFVVTAPDLLQGELGELLYRQVERDLRELQASIAWAREEARDAALLGFLQARGFSEAQRFTFSGVEMVVLERWPASAGSEA